MIRRWPRHCRCCALRHRSTEKVGTLISRIEHLIKINATAAQVWAVLTDFAAYADWNPFIRQAAGETRVGAKLRVTMQPQGHSPTRLQPTILDAQPERELRWLGHFLLPGIFDGEHRFLITPLDDHHVRFTQQETFGGVLPPFFGGMLKDTEASFEAMNFVRKSASRGSGRALALMKGAAR